MTPIFSENFLSHYLVDFNLSSVSKIRDITILLRDLVDELESGKFDSLKEEEMKSRFITIFFGDVLGFNYGNSKNWLLREEKKSTIDGKKADAALGYFSKDKSQDDVRAVIELKNAKSDLDKKEPRGKHSLSPVEQAFSYASGMGGNCKWVIVSNIKEIRFYPSLDKSKCQVFNLQEFYIKNTLNEEKLKELLFLFHKDNLFKKDAEKSHTERLFEFSKIKKIEEDKPVHIIDQLYKSLQRFKGLGFVNPNYLASLKPFNILDEYVWHYSNGVLFTLNCEIYELLVNLEVQGDEIKLSENLSVLLAKNNIIEIESKLKWVFSFLNECLVFHIYAVKNYKKFIERDKDFVLTNQFSFNSEEGVKKQIKIGKSSTCDCMVCNYRSLDFNKVLEKLKLFEGDIQYYNLEYAFINYLVATNSFKKTYQIYRSLERQIKGKQYKGIEYFLIKKNIKLLNNLFVYYSQSDKNAILKDILSIDLDKVIYEEIEYDIDSDVRRYLIDIKQEDLISSLKRRIDDTVIEIEDLKNLYENCGSRIGGSNLPLDLYYQHNFLFAYVNKNFILRDIFTDYRNMVTKVFEGFIKYTSIPMIGRPLVNDFILTEVIIHLFPKDINKILKNVDIIKLTDGSTEKILQKLYNFIRSAYEENKYSFNVSENKLLLEYLMSDNFKEKFDRIFANLFIVLSKIEISEEQFMHCRQPVINFLKVFNQFYWHNLSGLAVFILKKGYLFQSDDLLDILKIGVDRKRVNDNTYDELIQIVCQALNIYYKEIKIDDRRLISQAIINCASENYGYFNFEPLIYLINICNDSCRKMIVSEFEKYLDLSFDYYFYESLILKTDYSNNAKDYFNKYSKLLNQKLHNRQDLIFTSVDFYNYALAIYSLNIDFNRPELKILENLNDCETWILNPVDFDYSKFKVDWLIRFNSPIFFNRINAINHIVNAIETELRDSFNSELAEIKYKYFIK